MASRQIQFFGLIGGSLLILSVVLLFGKDLYFHWQKYRIDSYELQPIDSEQIIMQKSALEDLTQSLNDESDYMVEKNIQAQMTDEHQSKEVDKKPDLLIVDRELENQVSQKKENEKKTDKIDLIKNEIKDILSSHALLQKSAHIDEADKRSLEKIVSLLKTVENKNLTVSVEGHTQKGQPLFVSSDMAKEVSNYLQKSLASFKIKSVGYGNRYPVSDDTADISNKRVEIIIRRSRI